MTELRYRKGVLMCQLKHLLSGLRTLHEQSDRLILVHRTYQVGSTHGQTGWIGRRQRGDAPGHLPGNAQRLPTGSQHPKARCLGQKSLPTPRSRQKMLTVIQEQQQPFWLQKVGQGVSQRMSWLFAEFQGAYQGLRDQSWIG